MIEELLSKITNVDPTIGEGRYFYNGIAVPRVTEILSKMLHEDFLMTWANSIGLYKRQRYKETLERAANIGTYSHELVEQYTKNQSYDIESLNIQSKMEYDSAKNAVESYKLWYSDVFTLNNTINILGIEERLSCQWFGGTYDMLIEINGRTYLVDFKTSNHVGYKYCLQVAAYKYMLKECKGIEIDGAIILQLDKKTPCYTEYILDFANPVHAKFIEDCKECFLSLIYAYYHRINIETQFKNIF
jgi:hypothetical protein